MEDRNNKRSARSASWRQADSSTNSSSGKKKKYRSSYWDQFEGRETADKASDTKSSSKDDSIAERGVTSSTEFKKRPTKAAPPRTSAGKNKRSKNNNTGNNAKKKKRFGCLPLLIILLVLLGCGAAAAYHTIGNVFSKIENYSLDEGKMSTVTEDSSMDDYQVIALFGVDDQDNVIKDVGSRSDCIMLACINKHSKKVKLMSIYRDTYVSIDGEYDKINAAYSYGGPELALSTINRNLDLNVTDFATVNFKALADAVDTLGGVSLTVESQTELENLNDYIHNMNNINGGNSPKFDEPSSYPFTATFDGNQAVAYARIRYYGEGDHSRANHQRLVVAAIVDAVKKNPTKLKDLVDVVLPQCKTSLSKSQMTKMSLSLLRYEITDSQAYPFDSQDEKYDGIYYGFPLTVTSNVTQAHKYLFDTEDYQPSEELQKISGKIKNITDEIGLSSDDD